MTEFLIGVLLFAGYFLPIFGIFLLVRCFIAISDELCRKTMHFILLGAYIPILFGFDVWWHSLLFVICLIILLYPTLMITRVIPDFSSFVSERRSGEFMKSMAIALFVMAVSIAVGVGILQDKFAVLASVYAWGVGDALAALIGKRYGRHKIRWRLADKNKSAEGSLAMLVGSAVAVFLVLLIKGGVSVGSCALIAIAASSVSTLVEACCRGGLDTLFCPVAAMAVIFPLI